MRGRKPTPTALRVLRGNPRKRPINAAEPTPALLADADPPAWLARAAKKEWRRVAPMLTRLGVLTETDAAALAAYCEAWVTWHTATKAMRKSGMVAERQTENGPVLITSPYVKIAHEAMSQMRAFLVEFGMTPSARARIHTAAPADKPISKWAGKL
jgi:P27 family predicted phage terminase small subunit